MAAPRQTAIKGKSLGMSFSWLSSLIPEEKGRGGVLESK